MPVTKSRSSSGTPASPRPDGIPSAGCRPHFPFFANRRSRDDFGFGPFAGKSDANPPAFGAIPQHLPVVEYFIPFRL